jgi:hypothetical protein
MLTDVPTPFVLLMLVCNGVELNNFFISDSGLYDIGFSCFIIGLIRYGTEGLQSDKFCFDIGQGNIDVGYRIPATKIFDVAPTYGTE